MTMLIRRPPISRRGLLRNVFGGAAVTLALPFLDCHLNDSGTALAATGAPLPVRLGTWYWGMGHTPNHAVVEKRSTSPGIGLLEETEALKDVVQHLNFFGGFNMPLDGRSNYTHFTGWVANRTGSAPTKGTEIPAPTFDLLVAYQIGKSTRFKSLDLTAAGMDRPERDPHPDGEGHDVDGAEVEQRAERQEGHQADQADHRILHRWTMWSRRRSVATT